MKDVIALASEVIPVAGVDHVFVAQLAIENTWTANAQGQLQTVMALASTQENVLRAQDSERVNQSIDRLLASAPK